MSKYRVHISCTFTMLMDVEADSAAAAATLAHEESIENGPEFPEGQQYEIEANETAQVDRMDDAGQVVETTEEEIT